jgi:hypothetical protein
VLLAAGSSTRFGRPKQLEPLGPTGAALPAYTVLDALRVGFGAVVVVIRQDFEAPFGAQLREALGPDLPVTFVVQSLEDLPDGRTPAPGRRRPWGTGHAVLAASRSLGPTPFGVANADDWYGPEALKALAAFLSPAAAGEGCLVGYPLTDTLTPHGGVSRGRVRHDRGRVTAVEECTDLVLEADGLVHGRSPVGAPVALAPDEYVSMNLWGLPGRAPSLLAERFRAFLEALDDPRAAAAPEAEPEFLLSQALGALTAEGSLSLRLLEEGRRWFGVTHAADAPAVRARLAALHEDGTYRHRVHLEAGAAHPCS